MCLDFCFDQLPHTMMKNRAEGEWGWGGRKKGETEGQKFFALFISRKI